MGAVIKEITYSCYSYSVPSRHFNLLVAIMIEQKESKYLVIDMKTKEVISEHPFDSDYTKAKALEAAKQSNSEWKESKS